MSLNVDTISFRTRWMRTRFPFRYGIASMTELPHVFVLLRGSVDGTACAGLASEGLPPKWFTKDPGTRFEEDLPAMVRVIRHAAGLVTGSAHDSVFALWERLHSGQADWAGRQGIPPLLAHLGTSLVERAAIDAFCRGSGTTFARAVHDNLLGVDLGALHPELAGSRPADWLPPPLPSVVARHTVGLGDPLLREQIPGEDRVADGLPHALADAAAAYGLTHFKIKVSGRLETDVARLHAVAEVLEATSPGFRFTLDGNEQYGDVATFREHWEAYRDEPALRSLFDGERLLFVEQPLHRDMALSGGVGKALASWPEAPPMIIDESDAELDSLRLALELGYRGTSHKNCKGVIKGMANRCLIEWHRRNRPDAGPWVMSGEDLANVGPVALLNDLAAMAVLGIGDVERNGHHYLAGLGMFPEALQAAVCRAHPDLYAMRPEGYASLRIAAGRLSTRSVLASPFGHGLALDDQTLAILGEEGLPEITTDGRSIVISPADSHSEAEFRASLDRINERFAPTLKRLAE